MVHEIIENNDSLKKLMKELRDYDYETYEHSLRVGKLAYEIYENEGYPKKECQRVLIAGLLHDIGVLKVSYNVVHKIGKYNALDYQEMKCHTTYGYEILKKYRSDFDDEICKCALMHHERNNGNGYPSGVKSDKIPELAQFIGFLEVFVAFTTYKSYRRSYTHLEALGIMENYSLNEFNLSYSKYIKALYKY